jgi:hypothetical protein
MDGNDGIDLFNGLFFVMFILLFLGIYGMAESWSHPVLWQVFTGVGSFFFFVLLLVALLAAIDYVLENREIKRRYAK